MNQVLALFFMFEGDTKRYDSERKLFESLAGSKV